MDILCPSCGHDGGRPVWDRVTLAPGAVPKEKALAAALLAWHCPQCGQEFNFSTSCLYRDGSGRYEVYLRPGQSGELPEGAPGGLPAAGTTLRRVGGVNALIEKIRIFDDGLDDRVVEALKIFLYTSSPDEIKDETTSILYVGKGPVGNEIRCIAALKDGAAKEAALDRKYYDEIERLLAATASYAETEKGFAAVDMEWAVRAFEELSERE